MFKLHSQQFLKYMNGLPNFSNSIVMTLMNVIGVVYVCSVLVTHNFDTYVVSRNSWLVFIKCSFQF